MPALWYVFATSEVRPRDSGAVHDTAMLAPYTEAGMIFVPSINGRSHVPEENTHEEDLTRGAQFLKDFIEAFK